MNNSMKRQKTFLAPFESDKGRNKQSKFHSRQGKKTHTRCKSGITKLSRRNNLNKSVIETTKQNPSASIDNRASGLITPSNNIDKLIRDNLKKNKEIELIKEIEHLHHKEDILIKREAIHKMNEDVRKHNGVKLKRKKIAQKPKNLTVKLSTGAMKPERSKFPLSAKGSFVQEFKKIRREIEDELKREECKYKSRVSTACVSPKNMTHSMLAKYSEDPIVIENEVDHVGRKKSIRKFMKQKKKKFK